MDSAELLDIEVDGLVGADLDAALAACELARRRLAALEAAIIDRADQAQSFRVDGHRSTYQWVSAVTNCAHREALRRVRAARAVRDLPVMVSAWAGGHLGCDQVDMLARLHHHPRATHALPDSETVLVDAARSLRHRDFEVVVERWLAYADPDGCMRDHDDAHHHRRVDRTTLGTEFQLHLHTTVTAGTEINSVIDHVTQALIAGDWEQLVAHDGDHVHPTMLPRTVRQARADALLEICRLAASVGVRGKPIPSPLVNLVVDHDTFEHTVQRMAGLPTELIDPATVLRRRCETIDGHPVDPRHVVAAALVGRVRQVVFDPHGRVMHLGRRRRLFNHAVRDAIAISDRHCEWLCCAVASSATQVDHLLPHARGGLTDPDNAGPACGHHNRKRTHGYTAHRDRSGTWHIHRPDGTEIAPLDLHAYAAVIGLDRRPTM